MVWIDGIAPCAAHHHLATCLLILLQRDVRVLERLVLNGLVNRSTALQAVLL